MPDLNGAAGVRLHEWLGRMPSPFRPSFRDHQPTVCRALPVTRRRYNASAEAHKAAHSYRNARHDFCRRVVRRDNLRAKIRAANAINHRLS